MILDRIENASLYAGLPDNARKAFDYLADTDFMALEPGRFPIDGERIFALLQDYQTKPRDQGVWEAHRRFIDVQYIVRGTELMGIAPLDSLTVTQPYAPEKDCVLLKGTGDFITATAGTFAVFFPHDAHMPGVAIDTPQPVRKVVVKIACSDAGRQTQR